MREVLSFAVLCIPLSITSAADTVQQIQDVKSIYVASFGDGDGPELIRSKIISRLVKSGKLTVVETPGHADAVLTGVGELSKTTHYDASAGRFEISRDSLVLVCLAEIREFCGRMRHRPVLLPECGQIVKNLLKAMSPSKKK